jgi:hypothetical protein
MDANTVAVTSAMPVGLRSGNVTWASGDSVRA